MGGWRRKAGKVHFIMYCPGGKVGGVGWKISVPYCPEAIRQVGAAARLGRFDS